jgi:hypothetical protein
MIIITLTDREAKKLREFLGNICTDATLARIYERLDIALKRPAVKRQFNVPPRPNPIRGEDD